MSESNEINYWPNVRNTIYDLRLQNDDETVIGRIKEALCNVTFGFYKCVFKGKPWPKELTENPYNSMERKWIEETIKAIWAGDGHYTDGFENETDEFLDAIGLPRRERAGLIRTIRDTEGLVCAQCGKVGRIVPIERRNVELRSDDYFMIFPDGKTICCACDRHNNLYGEVVAK